MKVLPASPKARSGNTEYSENTNNPNALGDTINESHDQPSIPDLAHEKLQAALAGDRTAFGWLITEYWDPLFRWLYRMTRNQHQAEDLAQETFMKAFLALESFRPGSNFRAWLFRIAHNNFVNLKRRERRISSMGEMDKVTTVTPEVSLESRELHEQLEQVIENLPAEFRAALLLRVDQDLSFRDIALILGTTEETARWRVYKARQNLLRDLNDESLPDQLKARRVDNRE